MVVPLSGNKARKAQECSNRNGFVFDLHTCCAFAVQFSLCLRSGSALCGSDINTAGGRKNRYVFRRKINFV